MEIKVINLEGKTFDLTFKEHITVRGIRKKLQEEYNYNTDHCYFCRSGKILENEKLPKDGCKEPIIIFNSQTFPDKSYPRVDNAFNLDFSRYSDSFIKSKPVSRSTNDTLQQFISSHGHIGRILHFPFLLPGEGMPRIIIERGNTNTYLPVSDENIDRSFSDDEDAGQSPRPIHRRYRVIPRIVSINSQNGELIGNPIRMDSFEPNDALLDLENEMPDLVDDTGIELPQNLDELNDQDDIFTEQQQIDQLMQQNRILQNQLHDFRQRHLNIPAVPAGLNLQEQLPEQQNQNQNQNQNQQQTDEQTNGLNEEMSLVQQIQHLQDLLLNVRSLHEQNQLIEQQNHQLDEENNQLEQQHQQLELENQLLEQQNQQLEEENHQLEQALNRIQQITQINQQHPPDTQNNNLNPPRNTRQNAAPNIHESGRRRANVNQQIIEALNLNVTLTEQDNQAISRLAQTGLDRLSIIQIYFACDRNEETAMNLLVSMGD